MQQLADTEHCHGTLKNACLRFFLCVEYSAEGPGGAGSVFCPSPPAGETNIWIHQLQEQKKSRGEYVCVCVFVCC